LRYRRALFSPQASRLFLLDRSMKLTKQQATAHESATKLLEKPKLTLEERLFVLEHWDPGAEHINCLAGAYFTPLGLARDFAIEVSGDTIIDLCAGIGTLGFFATLGGESSRSIVCVESNPDYVAVGRKILPGATWLCCDIFQLPDVGHFRCAIGNSPFGAARRSGRGPRYRGARFEYHTIDVASDLADDGVFIVPQSSSPFQYSGKSDFTLTAPALIPHYQDFFSTTCIELEHNCGIDTSIYQNEWKGVSPPTEVVLCDFQVARGKRRHGTSGELFPQSPEDRAERL
jgi:hypothetical protein